MSDMFSKLSLLGRGIPKLISKERMCDAVDTLISLQNPSGGFASYELVRAPKLLEYINPAEVFGT